MKFILTLIVTAAVGVACAQKNKPQIGIVQDFKQDSLITASGYTCLVESISKCFSPKNVSDQQFEENLAQFKKLKTKIFAVNVFIPGELKLVGPDIKEADVLAYANKVLRRCSRANVTFVVFGSGGARRIPDGFDRTRAREQFVAISRKLADLARKHAVTIVLENLNSTETNFITTASEALSIVQEVNHPRFRLCVDIYHMLKEGEPASVIEKAKEYAVHCDIAEKEGRTPPGTKGDDFRPYLAALKKIGYSGKIILECRWENLSSQAKPAYDALQKQLDDVYRK